MLIEHDIKMAGSGGFEPPVEAAAAQTPVVATRVGGIPEAMCEGKNGLIVNYNDPNALSGAIFTILEDDSLRIDMGKVGREFSKDFSWTSIVNQLESEYFELL
jgi:D-inositol-3-phosphate glycosyltransferase